MAATYRTATITAPHLGALVKRHRDSRRWSQERLSFEATIDHSLVSRIESGQRNATRETIERIAVGLGLTATQADELRIAAGDLPADPANAMQDEPTVPRLYRLLRDPSVPEASKVAARAVLAGVVALIEREATRG